VLDDRHTAGAGRTGHPRVVLSGTVSRRIAADAQSEGVRVARRERRHTPRAPRKRRIVRSRAATALVLVLLVALAFGAVVAFAPGLVGWPTPQEPDPEREPAAVAPPPGLELPAPAPAAEVADPVLPAEAGRVRPAAVRRVVEPRLDDPDLGRHVVVAVGDLTGNGPTWTSGDGRFVPASTTKLLTVVSALASLGPEHRFTTRVVGAGGNRVVLVGGGDPFLASRPVPAADRDDAWPDRADVVTLARRVARALAEEDRGRVRVAFDASLFTGPADNPAWEESYVPDGVVSPISALWVDEGRAPNGWSRVDDPAAQAAETFADALRRQGVTVAGRPRPVRAREDAPVLAEVRSAPLGQIGERVLEVSDNEAAEVLSRHVGLEVVGQASFEGGVRGAREVLAGLDVPLDGDRWFDGSGLSRRNRLTTDTLLAVLRRAASPANPDLRAAVSGLPVAGFSGSLADRFAEGPPAGLGRVRAKTGTLTGVHGLAGLVTDRTGTVLAFVAVADRVRLADNLDAREAVDRMAAALAACRCGRD
jgi:D-alanyl-D-alanine carboxypeptidase/D-alanyl-D-alanine-endopeptidase (penicillin-binding protein 4)